METEGAIECYLLKVRKDGKITIPIEVRRRHGWEKGQQFMVQRTATGFTLTEIPKEPETARRKVKPAGRPARKTKRR